MKFTEIQEEMNTLCQSKNWRNLVGLIDEGYKGLFVILRILSDEAAPLSSGALAVKTGVSTARIASALNTLEAKGFVRRESVEGDGRKVQISLTKDGEMALENRKRKVEEMIEPMLSNLSDEEASYLFFILRKLLR